MRTTWVFESKDRSSKKAEVTGVIRAKGQAWNKHPQLDGISRGLEKQMQVLRQAQGEDPQQFAMTTETGRQIFGLTLDFTQPKTLWFETLRKGLEIWISQGGGLAVLKHKGLMVSLETLSPEHQAEVVGALAFFSVTQSWKPKNYARSKKLKTTSPTLGGALNSSLTETEFKKISLQGAALGRANNQVRTWSCMPANHLTPMAFRRELDRFARSYRLKTTFINRKGLERLGAGAFLAVLRADPKSEGGLLKLSYRPRKSSSQKAIALVGKGLCYDTGGYNIKTGGHMFGMHQDMTGAALVAAFLGYLREVDYPAPVDAYIALAQNLVSESGYTPNEVVQAMDGTTIEVVDTDAEGRMVLSDTLAYVRKQKPRFVVDFATLTGSAIRSIGTTRSAVFSNQSETGLRAFQAGENSGERVWLFPLGEEYERSLESEVADILQCSHEAGSDHIYAATFLSRFVGKEIPWVHMDLSANSRKGGLGLIGSETTGFGILWVKSFLELMAKK